MSLGSPVLRGACALALTCALAAAPSRARGGDEPPPDSEPPVELPEVVVRVPRAATIVEPTAAATVVPAERYAGEAKGVAELLAASPGVEITRYGARGQLATVQIRGVDAQGVKILVDGLPLGSAGGAIDLTTIPRSWIERVEVVRGPSAADVGAGALGGAVNVITRAPTGAAASGELTVGSFGTYEASAEGTGRAGPLSVLAGATAETTRGDFPYLYDAQTSIASPVVPLTRENDGSRRGGLIVKVGGPLGALRLDGVVQVSGGHRELPGTSFAPTPEDWMDDGRALVMARVAGAVTDAVTLAARVHGRADLLDTRLSFLMDPQTQQVVPARQRGGAGGGALEARVAHPGGALALTVEASGEGYRSTGLGGARSRATLAASTDEAWFAVPGRLRVEPAVRVERVGPFSGTSAKLGAALRLVDGLSARASVGRTFRVPSFDELFLEQGLLAPNPDLRPEVGTGADAALAYEGALGVASLGGHVTTYDDLITYEPASFGRFKAFNTARALAAGLEAEVATAPARRLLGLSFQGAYTLLHTETLRGGPDEVGNALPRRPRHRLQARAAIAPGRFTAHVDARVVRDEWQNSLNTERVPDETVFSAGASVLLFRAPRLSLHVEVENLADVRSLQDGFGQPLPGRTLMVSLRAGASQEGIP